MNQPPLVLKSQAVVEHTHEDCFKDASGKFIARQPVKSDSQSKRPVESKSMVVRKSKPQERSSGVKSCFVGFVNPLEQGCIGDSGPCRSSLYVHSTKRVSCYCSSSLHMDSTKQVSCSYGTLLHRRGNFKGDPIMVTMRVSNKSVGADGFFPHSASRPTVWSVGGTDCFPNPNRLDSGWHC